ncbi:hypothetical protein PILCRDRAFT_16888 [Piloderma croceum F 1598]|uniref:Uncharacterized protein n=1 Tax=Piloderma croceum (strain F 1598) TaxID=765440 RepID=A0A0C3EG73_PILCF|nr:hypothetical protein PILCRDRAFT_16888 [Piloderma croceum F 1598]
MYPAAQSIVLVRRTSRRTRRERRPIVEDSTNARRFWFQIALPFMGDILGVPFQIHDFVFWWEESVVSYGYITVFSCMSDDTVIARINRHGYYACRPGAIVLLPTSALNSLVP